MPGKGFVRRLEKPKLKEFCPVYARKGEELIEEQENFGPNEKKKEGEKRY
jgi:hypothetical protein